MKREDDKIVSSIKLWTATYHIYCFHLLWIGHAMQCMSENIKYSEWWAFSNILKTLTAGALSSVQNKKYYMRWASDILRFHVLEFDLLLMNKRSLSASRAECYSTGPHLASRACCVWWPIVFGGAWRRSQFARVRRFIPLDKSMQFYYERVKNCASKCYVCAVTAPRISNTHSNLFPCCQNGVIDRWQQHTVIAG